MTATAATPQDSAAQRLATGRAVLIALGILLVVALAALDTERGKRRAELEEFVLEPIAPAANIPQMALAQAYRGSMLWYFSAVLSSCISVSISLQKTSLMSCAVSDCHLVVSQSFLSIALIGV